MNPTIAAPAILECANTAMKPILLIVDDDTAVREGLKLALEIKGYNVASAADAEAAIDWLTASTPALVILDCQLPGMSGAEAAGYIRGRFDRLPILAISANREREAEMVSQGVTAFRLKPLDIRAFVAEIDSLTGKKPPT